MATHINAYSERKLDGKVRKDRERLEGSQEVLVLGNSRVKYLDETFCEADRARRMTCCLSGAGVQDVVERYKRVVEGTGKEALVVVHVGVKDVGSLRSEELVDRYRELLREIKKSGRRCIVSGVLPKRLVALTCPWPQREVDEDVWGGWGRFYG